MKLKIHPLFYAFGLYYAITGRIMLFLMCTITAVIHELGHSAVASRLGYRLNKITLMPFGAVVTGNTEGLKFFDEIKIAVAGPLINLLIVLFFVALWWLFPEVYAFTDSAVIENLSMALINLIPAYPLDGGRILCAFLSVKVGKEKATNICKYLGLSFGIILFGAFVLSIFYNFNLSLLFFSLFIIVGAFSNEKENKYVKIYTFITKDKLSRGIAYKKQGVSDDITVRKLMSILDSNAINEIVVFKGDKPITILSQQNIENIIEKGDFTAKISNYI